MPDLNPTFLASDVIALFNLEIKFPELENILKEPVNTNKLAVML